MKLHLFIGVLLGLFFTQTTQAATWYVNFSAGGNQTGTSWSNAYKELQPAMNKASKGDTIWVAKGTYYPTIAADGKSNDDRDKAFVLKDGVHVFGGFKGTENKFNDRLTDSTSLHVTNITVLSGDLGKLKDISDNAYHIVISSSLSSFTLDGFTIENGNANGKSQLLVNALSIYQHYAGGVYNESTIGTYKNIIITNNIANSFDDEEGGGGGMYNLKGKLTIQNSIFIDNVAENCNGGAMKNDASSPRISNTYFIDNTSNTTDEGGGAINNIGNSNAIFNDVVFVGNSTNGSGGAIYNDESSPEFTNVLFQKNAAKGSGGGIDADGASNVILNNVTFNSNFAAEDGGGFFSWKSNPVFNNVRFYNNHADNNGGGMYCYNTCNPIITNSIFHGNYAGNDYGGFGLERNSKAIVTNVEFSRNQAINNGGGLGSHDNHNTNATLILTNITIVNNIAANGGGGYDYGKTSEFRNSIVIGNYPDDVDIDPNLILNAKHIISTNKNGVMYVEDGSVNPYGVSISGPFFTDTTNNDYSLKTGSAAIDLGDSSFFNKLMNPDLSAIITDIVGLNRIMGKNIDLGAYERCSMFISPKVALSFSPKSQILEGNKVTFSLTLTDAGQNPEIKWWKNSKEIPLANDTIYAGIAGTDYIIGDTIWATVLSLENCASPNKTVSNKIITDYCTQVIIPKAILTFSSNTQILAGTKITFTLDLTDAGQNPKIFWWKNNQQIPLASDSIYTGIADIDFNSGDTIWATILSREKCASTDSSLSNSIVMDYCSTLTTPIAVLTATSNTQILTGTIVTFTLDLTNSGQNPEIIWWKNGQQIPMATDTVYIGIADTDFNSGDEIWATVRSFEKCANPDSSLSNSIIMDYCSKIITPVAVLTVSSDTQILAGTSVIFTLDLKDAGQNPEIVWWKNGQQIPMATDTVYIGIANTDFNIGDEIWATVRSFEKCANPDSSLSNSIVLNYCSEIITPTADLTFTPLTQILAGTQVTFTLDLKDAGQNPEIIWWKNGIQISGASDVIYLGIADTDFNSGDTIWATVRSIEECASPNQSLSNKVAMNYCSEIINPSAVLTVSPDTLITVGTQVTFNLDLTDAGQNPEIKWWKNGQQIPLASDVTYTGIADTDFNNGDTIWATVRSIEQCNSLENSMSNIIVINYSETGNTNSLVFAYNLNIFPNPSNGIFSIQGNFNIQKEYSLNIVDVTGRNIYQKLFQGSTKKMQIQLPESIVSGFYFLTIYQKEQGSQTIRFIVK